VIFGENVVFLLHPLHPKNTSLTKHLEMKFLLSITLALTTATLVLANQAETNPNGGGGGTYSPPSQTGNVKSDSSMTCQVLAGTNDVRERNGKPGNLKGSKELDDAACHTCKLMMDNDDLAHDLYDKTLGKGTTPGERCSEAGYNWFACAENILFNKGYGPPNAKRAVKQWEDSPGHFKNMMGDYTHHGSCHCTDTDGRCYFAQEFGKGDSNCGVYTCGTESYTPPPPPPQETEAGNLGTGETNKPTYTQPTEETDAETDSTPQTDYTPTSIGTINDNNKTGPNGLPCVASTYGNKSPGYQELKKRGQSKSLANSGVVIVAI
jgi:uncharacterized protein YkwD